MSLQLILGGAGYGKTTVLYQRIIQDSMLHGEQQYFLMVPEQFSLQTQKDVITMHPRHGTMNIDVVSFRRLAYRVFEELAADSLTVLDDMGKSMVLRKVAGSQKRSLVLFSGHLGQAGFISQMRSMLSEFYQYGITPEVLREMAPLARSSLLRQKLEDFALVFQGFQEYIAGHFITSEEVLDVLCRVLPNSALVKNSVIALDGFVGFTPVQYRVLSILMRHAKRVIATVTADPRENLYGPMGMQNLFFMSHQMARKLKNLAETSQVSIEADQVLDGREGTRFSRSRELAWLEKQLFRCPMVPYTGEPDGSVELYQAMTPSDEIAEAARRILELVKKTGLRYRDVAVVTGDLESYGKEILHQFGQNDIPYFLDDKKTVMDHALVELIRSALEAVRRDFSYESVFRFLRTGLVSQEREPIDRMENYVIALGIRGGKRWRQTWDRQARGMGGLNLKELNEFKEQALRPLFTMQDTLKQENCTIAVMTAAVKTMLEDCGAREKLEQCRDRCLEAGEYRLAREYDQIYDLAEGLLDRLSDLLGEEQVGRREFQEILDAGFGELSVGAIPATVDRVVVGDLTRTRLAHVKVLFFVGVNDGIVPVHREGGGIFTDKDREFFAEHQLEMAPTARENSFRQRFYLYLTMTKPSDRLILSYSCSGGDGKGRRPSYLIGEIRRLFPQLVCREEKGDALYSVSQAMDRLVDGLRRYRDGELEKTEGGRNEEQSRFFQLYQWFLDSKDYGEEARRLADAAFYIYEKQGIGHAVAQALYGSILSGSVTRLEQYAACAYGHFLKYGLELMERQHYELAASDLGNLFHDSIDLCFQRVKEQGLDWRSIRQEERRALVSRCVREVTEKYGNTILSSSARNAYLARRVEQITQRTVWALQQQLLKGDFVPTGFEVSFSSADHLQAMKISLSREEKLHLEGRIDRLDLCQDGRQIYVKIIDYKSGSTSFDLLALYYGLQLQLVVYLDAAMELTRRQNPDCEVVPAGILYYNIGDPMVDKETDQTQESIEEEILRRLKMNGLVNSDPDVVRHLDHTIEKESDVIPVVLKNGQIQAEKSSVASRERFERLQQYVHRRLKEFGREILDGDVAVAPYKNGQRTACDYCPYHAVCGFDKKMAGYDYRRWKKKSAEEIWEEVWGKTQ